MKTLKRLMIVGLILAITGIVQRPAASSVAFASNTTIEKCEGEVTHDEVEAYLDGHGYDVNSITCAGLDRIAHCQQGAGDNQGGAGGGFGVIVIVYTNGYIIVGHEEL